MPAPVGKLFAEALAATTLSQHAFCQKVDYDQDSLQGVIKGQCHPPLGREELWADTLELRGEARREFLVSYWLAHAPPQLGVEFDRLRSQKRT